MSYHYIDSLKIIFDSSKGAEDYKNFRIKPDFVAYQEDEEKVLLLG